MKRYNIQGMGGKFWVQERVLFLWVDVMHLDLMMGNLYRREFDDLDAAYAEVNRLRGQDRAARCGRGLLNLRVADRGRDEIQVS